VNTYQALLKNELAAKEKNLVVLERSITTKRR
jgi:hypothetical protein